MATRMMLRTSNNNVPLQLLRLIKDKTVVKSFPTVVDRSVFCGGSPWTMHRKDEVEEEVKDGFIREMRNGNLELLKGKSIGVEMRGLRMVSDEDEDYDDDDDDDDDGGCDSEGFDDFGGGDEDTDFDSDGDGDDDDEEKDVKKSRK